MQAFRCLTCRCIASLCCLLVAGQTACVFDTSGLPASCGRYECTVPIYKCATWNYPLSINLNGANTCYKALPPATLQYPNIGLRVGDQAYCDRPWTVRKIDLPTLRGALWVQAPFTMNTSSTDVQFQVLNEVEGVYVAYDSRLTTEPSWLLGSDFAPETVPVGFGGLSDEPVYIAINMPDSITNKTEVDLRIWRYTKVPKVGDIVTIPGNQSGNPQWSPGLQSNQTAMYMVIVRPKQGYDCTQLLAANKVDEAPYDNCSKALCEEDLEAVKTGAKNVAAGLLQRYPAGTHTVGEPTCKPVQVCPDRTIFGQTYGLSLDPRAFIRNSEIEFDPVLYKSQATITVGSQSPVTSNATGILHFEYELDELHRMPKITVNAMTLDLDDIHSGDANFTDIVVALLVPVTATCRDANPPFGTPCNVYDVPAGEFLASVAADDGSGTTLLVAENANPLQVQIDHANRGFTIQGGPLNTTLKVNNEDQNFDISIDLTGHFLNFAVNASGDESDKFGECSMDREYMSGNKDPIHLDASTSFEIYNDALPTDPNSYRWYEDYALVTERFLGVGKQLTIAAHQLGFGVHSITLLVRDDHGVADLDTFDVEVLDTQAPNLTVPQDRIRMVLPPDTVPVAISVGQAWAWDTCANDVWVTNDAPDTGLFDEGITQVTWQADDGNGNVTSGVQEVTVIDYQGSLLDKIKQGIVQLEKAAGKTQTAMQQCDDVTDCMVDVSSLVEVASQLVELMYAMSSDDQQQADYDATLNNLEPAAAALTEADRLWTSSQEIDGDEQASLREAASAQLTTAAERFEAITAPADNNQPPPSQGGCGGAGGLGIVTMLSMLTGLMGLRYSRRCGRRS